MTPNNPMTLEEKVIQIGSRKPRLAIRGEKNYQWKGDNASCYVKHRWMRDNYGKPQFCEDCGTTEVPEGKRIDRWFQWANISGKYFRERSDWKILCKLCHVKFDWHRMSRGENQAAAKLTDEKVRELRKLKRENPKLSQAKLAKMFNICTSTAARTLNGTYWKHVLDNPEAPLSDNQ